MFRLSCSTVLTPITTQGADTAVTLPEGFENIFQTFEKPAHGLLPPATSDRPT
jgi:hypothetical protein